VVGQLREPIARAAANFNVNSVSVLLRNAANTGFDPEVDSVVGTGPLSLAVGDFNGDGKQDLVAANVNAGTVSVLLRNAANTGFDPKVDFMVGEGPGEVEVGDFNGDGKQDIVTANRGSNSTVSVLLRNAANTGFDPTVDFAVGAYPFSVTVGDFNGDGKQDIVTANSGNGIGNTASVLLRNAANTGFDPKVDFAVGANPWSVAVGDFNGDNRQDIVAANIYGRSVSVLLRNCMPTITVAAALSRQQGSAAGNSQIAIVSDVDQAADTLSLAATPLTGTGVSINGISVDGSGNVTANVAASCTATSSTFTLTVTDNAVAMSTATLTVNVTANSAPTLSYANQSVAFGGSSNVNPTAAQRQRHGHLCGPDWPRFDDGSDG
jgi:hypothetical protein